MPSSENVKQKRCGLIMPISAIDGYPASHWEAVLSIIKEALSETEFSVQLVSVADDIGVIQKRIVQNIYDNEIIVCDVSAKNPNVMLELGMRLAFDKPAIIIKDDKTNYSFDTAPIEHLEYPIELNYHKIQAFKTKLRDKVVATFDASKSANYTTFLKHFGHFVIADIEEKKVGKEDYLLEAVSELRGEVRSLAKRLDIASFRVPSKNTFETMLSARPSEESLEEERQRGMSLFVQDYLGKMSESERDTLMQDTDSIMFQNMFHAFLESKFTRRELWNRWRASELKMPLYLEAEKYLHSKK
jgi:hypothetical protein